MKRPGFLGDFQSLTPRQVKIMARQPKRAYGGFGFFGKGFVAPPPSPGNSNLQVITTAINTKTGRFYEQDVRCPEGEKMMSKMEPCEGQDCCDASGCDFPGTLYPEEECDDDPDYRDLPDEPEGGFTSCNEWRAAGYPEPCDQNTCPSCFAPPPPPPQAQQASSNAAAPNANLQAELLKLEAENRAVEAMPTAPAASSYTAPQYTGSVGPIPTRAAPRQETEQDRLMELVEAHESQKARQPITPVLPPVASRPAPASVEPAEDEGGVTGLFSWLRSALFGSPSYVEGLGDWSQPHPAIYLIPVVVGVATALVLKKRNSNTLRKKKRKAKK